MEIAFILYKYFPYGGLQRDFLRIARECAAQGCEIRVYSMDWEGEREPDWEIHLWRPFALTGHGRNERFQRWVHADLARRPVDAVVGFNKMAGLDLYYAADGCYEAKISSQRGNWYKHLGRYRHFAHNEQAVFAAHGNTEIMMISRVQQPFFEHCYGTPPERFVLLPPGIARDRRAPTNAPQLRADFRKAFALTDDERLMLMIGSGFKTKGLDRALRALAALPPAQRTRTRLFVIGQDDSRLFKLQAARLGIAERVTFFAGRDDIPRFLLGADLLIHPAYNENTGTVLLEALAAGLPVLCTDVCGYAHYIAEADAGVVLTSPFEQTDLDRTLATMLTSEQRAQWQRHALAFADQADIYSLPQRAAERIIARARLHTPTNAGTEVSA